MNRLERIKVELGVLKPQFLEITDQTDNHNKHFSGAGAHTHLTINIKAAVLENHGRLEQHKIINKLLAKEFQTGLYALSIKIKIR